MIFINKLLMSKEQRNATFELKSWLVQAKVEESLTQLVEYKSKQAEEYKISLWVVFKNTSKLFYFKSMLMTLCHFH